MGPHRAEANLAALIESTEDLIWSVDLDHRLLAFNRAFRDEIQRNYGLRAGVGVRLEDLLPPARAALWPPLYDRALSEGSFRAEYSLHGGRTLELAFNRIVQDGETTGISVFGKDITERKTAEKTLLEAEKQYRDIFDGAIEGIFRTSLEGKYLAANSALAKMLGYDSAQELVSAINDSAHQVWLDPNERSRFLQLVEQHEIVRGYEGQFKRKDGTAIWVSLNCRNVCGKDGRTLYNEGFIEDITERKRADEKLRESERQLRTVLETIALVGVMLDRQGNITLCNDFLLALSGWKREEVLRRNWFELFLPSEICGRIRQEIFLDTIGTGEIPTHYQNEIITRKGERRLVDWNNTVIRDPGGQIVGVASIGEDITERKRAEAEKAKIEDQLRQAQKLESVGRLAAGVAHDFNNLLTVINGYSRLLLGRLKAGDPLRDGLEEIHKAGERAAGLTQQLLAFSRKQILQPRVLDLNRVVEEMRPMLERLMGEDVEVCVQLQAEAATICADPNQLERVLMNLAGNSRDAMPDGGKFSIETGFVEWDESHAQLRPGTHAGPYVMLAVSDTGGGMSEETRGHIFEPFFTTKEVGKGTGLGLSTIHGIVEQSGGYIEVASELGRGTTFKIYIPRVVDAQADSGKPEAAAAMGGQETVLVVEDQAEVREFAAAALRTYGYQVIEAANAEEALMLWEREGERIDLILTDVVMPGLSGRELADRLKEREHGIKVLFMSGHTDDTMVHHGVLRKEAEFIQKPFGPDQLARKVREVLMAADRPARIVVADDEAGARSFLRKVLEDGGYEVMEAPNGKLAVKEALAGRVDLVITDLVMPEQEGIETIRILRREVPGVGIIAISGALGGQFLEVARKLGAQAVLSKPVSGELLLAKVAEVLKSRR
jgi:PAS domain S-box-containing protein